MRLIQIDNDSTNSRSDRLKESVKHIDAISDRRTAVRFEELATLAADDGVRRDQMVVTEEDVNGLNNDHSCYGGICRIAASFTDKAEQVAHRDSLCLRELDVELAGTSCRTLSVRIQNDFERCRISEWKFAFDESALASIVSGVR